MANCIKSVSEKYILTDYANGRYVIGITKARLTISPSVWPTLEF
ncbi:hypothetical protein [Paenibacillus sp. A3]|nr:hypothetical protein [Paenibacillus sp. A3]